MFHIPGCTELTFFNVDDLAGFGCSDHQVGLPAQKSRYLKHVNILGNNAALFLFMNVGNNRNVIVELFDFLKSQHSLFKANPAGAVDGCAVGFVEGSLENIVYAKLSGNFDHGAGHVNRMLAAFNLTRAGKQCQGQFVADFEAADFDSSLFHNGFPLLRS